MCAAAPHVLLLLVLLALLFFLFLFRYDAGDNVKFNFPMAWSAHVLAWSIVDFADVSLDRVCSSKPFYGILCPRHNRRTGSAGMDCWRLLFSKL